MSYSAIAKRTTEVFTPDALLLSTEHTRTKKRTLASGQNLARGAVVGVITSGGRLTLSTSAATNGSEVPRFILAEACNASGGDAECIVYETGEFNAAALIFGAGHTAASTEQTLRGQGIYIQNIQGA